MNAIPIQSQGQIDPTFPFGDRGEVRNALGVAREEMDPELSGRVLKFCRYVASRLEILRLREAVADRERQTRMLREFTEQLRNIDAENFWQRVTSVSAELVGAERASLLMGARARILGKGIRAPARSEFATDLGERVARSILEKGKPVLVVDIACFFAPAPAEAIPFIIVHKLSDNMGDKGIA